MALSRATLDAPSPTLLLRDRHGHFLGESGAGEAEDFGYWPLDELPPRLVAATLAIEDRRFRRHPGVDLRAIARAAVQNFRSGRRVSGASTIAMQVARMQHPGSRTYPRKAIEALTAVMLTARYGRDEVLRHYLRIVPYGNRIHGIAYAARRYLDKPVVDLSWAETALLAAIPQAPARMNPFEPRGRVQAIRRGQQILARLAENGVLTPVEYEMARRQIVRLQIPPRGRRPEEAMHAVLRFEELLTDPQLRRTLESDPIVDTTLDLDLQREVSWLARHAVRRRERQGAGNAAVLVVDRVSWEVLAAVGSTDYFDPDHAGAIDYLRVARSSGSTLKPFLYALALERGTITPTTILDDLERGAGGIINSDERYLGPLLPRVALANSRNVPASNLLAAVGLDEGYALLGELGLHDGGEPARRYGLGLAIGGLPVTLEQLVRAYTVLAGDGRRRDLVWYRRQPRTWEPRLLTEATARQVTLFLADPQARLPTFPRMGWSEFPFAVAVKTGTSSRYRDAWTVAWSSRYLVGVWIGHPDFRPMARLSGYRAAAYLVHRILNLLHRDQRDGLEALSFPPPRGYHAQRVCAMSGRRATPPCPRVVLEWLPPGQEIRDDCGVHRHLAIDRRNGLLATSATPASLIEVRSFVDLPPRYAAWAMGAGIPHPPRLPSALGPGDAGLVGPAPISAFAALGRPEQPGRIEITSPRPGLRLLFDPETPSEMSTLALRAVVDPPPEQLVWYVDGQPWKTVEYPFSARWPLGVGEHTFQARVPFTDLRSGTVRIAVE